MLTGDTEIRVFKYADTYKNLINELIKIWQDRKFGDLAKTGSDAWSLEAKINAFNNELRQDDIFKELYQILETEKTEIEEDKDEEVKEVS